MACHHLYLTLQHTEFAQGNDHNLSTLQIKLGIIPCVENEAQDLEETDLQC